MRRPGGVPAKGMPLLLLWLALARPAAAAAAEGEVAGGGPYEPWHATAYGEKSLEFLEIERVAARPASLERWEALKRAALLAAAPELSDSRRAGALLEAGSLRLLVGDDVGAERDFQDALRLQPGDARAYYGLAQAIRDRPREALPHADHAARSAAPPRRRAAAHRLAAEIRSDLGDAAGAQASLESALESAGQDLEALRDMVWLKRETPPEAHPYALRAFRAAETAPLWCRPAAFRLSARNWLELKDIPRAMAAYRRALEVNPDDLEALENLVRIMRERPEASPVFPDSEPGASPLPPDPEDLESLRALIAAARERKRPREAAEFAGRFEEAIQEAPLWQQADAFRLLAHTWLELGETAKAQQAVRSMDELEPNPVKPGPLLSLVEYPGDREAEKFKTARSHIAIGLLRAELKEPGEAERSLNRALELVPGHPAALLALARVILDQGRPGEASALAGRVLKAAQAEPPARLAEIHRRVAAIQLDLEDRAGAERNLERALELVPGQPAALRMLTRLKLDRRRPPSPGAGPPPKSSAQAPAARRAESADSMGICFGRTFDADAHRRDVPHFDRCLEQFPDNPALYSNRGVARYLSGRPADALADFKKAVELRPDFLEARLSLASALIALGRPDEALTQTNEAVDLAKDREGPVYRELSALRDFLQGAKPSREAPRRESSQFPGF